MYKVGRVRGGKEEGKYRECDVAVTSVAVVAHARLYSARVSSLLLDDAHGRLCSRLVVGRAGEYDEDNRANERGRGGVETCCFVACSSARLWDVVCG